MECFKMAKLIALVAFKDLQDPIDRNEFHVYQKGDVYPRKGEVDPVRVEELKGDKNLRKEAVIAEETEVVEEVPADEVPADEVKNGEADPVKEEVPELTKAEEKKAKKEAAK